MSIRGRILGLLLNPYFKHIERIRVIQTLETLEHLGPYTTPSFQGDADNECTDLRGWVNQIADKDFKGDFDNHYYQVWARKCPFKKEVASNEEWAQREWFWKR